MRQQKLNVNDEICKDVQPYIYNLQEIVIKNRIIR